MKLMVRYVVPAVAGLSLGVCAMTSYAQDTGNAETACMEAVNNNYGGNVKNLDVISADGSQAGTEVILNADGETWRCLSSNDGQVEDLSVQEAAASSGPSSSGETSAAESACMVAVNGNYGGNVKELNVISAEFSEAGTLVMLDADGEKWRCLSSNDGTVEDLSVQ